MAATFVQIGTVGALMGQKSEPGVDFFTLCRPVSAARTPPGGRNRPARTPVLVREPLTARGPGGARSVIGWPGRTHGRRGDGAPDRKDMMHAPRSGGVNHAPARRSASVLKGDVR